MSFTFFDHTGDIGVRLTGRTLDDLFRDAAAAFTDSVVESSHVEPRESFPLALEAPAVDLLLVDWLSEILYRFEVDRFLTATAEVQIAVGSPSILHATVRGERFDPGRHRVKVLIKAVTYHALEVREEHGWHATVVFDI